MVVALNMMDEMTANSGAVYINEMEELLGNGDVTITISMQETISGKA